MKFLIEHCPPNPTFEYAESIVPPFETTEIVSKGGGSTIDVAKWVARKYGMFHHAIPTTAGTGSEATKYCVLMVDGKKTTFIDDAFIPTSYELDPRNVASCPVDVTISSGLDALSQAYEALWSKFATRESDIYSKRAIRIILKYFMRSVNSPNDMKARDEMLIGAHLSGKAINIAPTNICHAISYPLTEIYGIPHGLACGMSLSYFLNKNGTDSELIGKLLFLYSIKYDIDKQMIASIAIQNEKLKDMAFDVTLEDIINSL